jgi:hypothetical protein
LEECLFAGVLRRHPHFLIVIFTRDPLHLLRSFFVIESFCVVSLSFCYSNVCLSPVSILICLPFWCIGRLLLRLHQLREQNSHFLSKNENNVCRAAATWIFTFLLVPLILVLLPPPFVWVSSLILLLLLGCFLSPFVGV